MPKTEHKRCYGRMFPDTADSRTGQRIKGEAFWFENATAGGMRFGTRTLVTFCQPCAQKDTTGMVFQ